MTQEENQLLLIDLCARLPYHPIVYVDENLPRLKLGVATRIWEYVAVDKPCKPYLRPMSSMTEEEAEEFRLDFHYNFYIGREYSLNNNDGSYMMPMFVMRDYFNWLNAHHFDYRGLIPKGLALEAPEGMY